MTLSLVAILLLQTIVFLIFKSKDRYDIADVIWGPSIFIGSFAAFLFSFEKSFSYIVSILLVFIWAARLFRHINIRFKKKNSMDERYVSLLKNVKNNSPMIYVKVFVAQSILASIISITLFPMFVATLNIFFVSVGVMVWLVGFILESVADRQLSRHLSISHELMTKGLWKYSRHPNYFGEILQWWGLWTMSIGSNYAWISILGPLTISYLIIFVSGIPMLEKHMKTKLGWRAYASKTATIIPFLFIKK